jgi:D-alanyl-lipoteichoic acid acyltransferase DltB (MBOAT superfamily)
MLDYLYAFGVDSQKKRISRMFLWLSIVNNLSILGIFKYYDFFAKEFQRGFDSIGIHLHPVFLNIALPVGISFYTFHGMSYVFDIYRRLRRPVKNFIDYAVFVCFFPLLVAGPIERANHLLPQVQVKRTFSYTQAVEGCKLILWGMLKKVVIADKLAWIVDSIFDNYYAHHAFTLIIGAIAFSFQIYADFSGYSDMAIGTAKLFGVELFSNFKFPYFSRDIAEFWRRWHISLTSWFRDYLYIPLGGSKMGKLLAIRNTFIVFLVSGFWHGASRNFIIWGGIHACGFLPLLILNRNRRYVNEVVSYNRTFPTFKEFIKMSSTFTFVTFAWIFFRMHGLRNAVGMIKRIVVDTIHYPSQYLSIPYGLSGFRLIIIFVLIDWWLRRNEREIRITRYRIVNWICFLMMFLFVVSVFLSYLEKKPNSFIYFQF